MADVALTGIDPTDPIPGINAEIRYSQGESNGDAGEKVVLLIAPKTSDGSITVDSEVYGPITSEDDAVIKVGARSIARNMIRAFQKVSKGAALYVICPTAATGTATTDVITIAGVPTAAGLATLTFMDEPIPSAYTTSDTATTIAAGLCAAFNARTWLPATAANVLGVITITGSTTGVELNSVRFRCAVSASTGVTTTITADTAFGSGGSGTPGTGTISYTTALSNILARQFSYIVAGSQEGAPLLALCTQVNTQALPANGIIQQIIAGGTLTPAAAATLASGANLNTARAQFLNQEEAPFPFFVNAARWAGARYNTEISDPSYNHDFYGTKDGEVLGLKKPYNDSAWPTQAELRIMLNNGVTPVQVAANGTAFICRSVTTRCKDGSGNYDYRVRDTSVVTTGDRFLVDSKAKLRSLSYTKITADPVGNAKQPLAHFATPARVKAVHEGMVRLFTNDRGWLDPAKLSTVLGAISVSINTVNGSRMDSQVPIYAAVNLHSHALLVKESSPPVLPGRLEREPP